MPTPSAPAVPTRSGSNRLIAVVVLAGVTVALQQTAVIPLVPRFPQLLGASADDTTWVVTATVLTAAVSVPIIGRLADMFGRRLLLLICLAVLLVGSVVCALSDSLAPMIVGRALQGMSTGVISLGISLLRDALAPERIASAAALMSASLGVGAAIGLPASALVVQSLDWHALFWTSAALSLVVLVLVAVLVPEPGDRPGGRFDTLGALLLTVALVALLLATSKGSAWGWGSPLTVGLFVGAALVLPAWAVWQLRVRDPLVDLRAAARRPVLLTNLASVAFGFALFTSPLVFTQLLQLPVDSGHGLGLSLFGTGLVMVPAGLTAMAVSPVSARITSRAGGRTTLLLGAAVVAAGYVLGALLHAEVWHVVLGTVVISAGVGLAYGAMPTLIMAAAPRAQTAAANSLNNLMRSGGVTVASAVCGALLAALSTRRGGVTVPTEAAFVAALLLGAGAAVLALGLAAALPRPQRPARRGEDPLPVRPARWRWTVP